MTNEKFDQIAATGRTVEVNDTSLEVKPMKMKEFVKSQQAGQNDMSKGIVEMFYHSLDEDIDREGIRNAPAMIFKPVMEAIEEVNEFEDFFSEEEKQEALRKLQ